MIGLDYGAALKFLFLTNNIFFDGKTIKSACLPGTFIHILYRYAAHIISSSNLLHPLHFKPCLYILLKSLEHSHNLYW